LTTTVKPARIKNVVITRSKRGNEELSGRLNRAGFNPITVDTIYLSPPEDWSVVDGVLRRLHSFDWLVFTSAIGVEYFESRMNALSLRLGWEGKPLVASVGQRTAEKLSGLDVRPSFTPSSFLTVRLAEELPAEMGRRVLLLRADIADPKLSEGLRARGFDVEEASIYRTRFVDSGTDDRLRDADLIVFASPSAVRGFCRIVPKKELSALQRVRAICIGPVTAAAAQENGFAKTVVPKMYTLDSVVGEIVRLSEQDA
jgi:uroporphyrinogen-III synthase